MKYYRLSEEGEHTCELLYMQTMPLFSSHPLRRKLVQILTWFSDVTGLKTNLQKISIVPIKCEGVDLPSVLINLPAQLPTFPMRCLGMPLSIRKPRKVHLQPLIDKIGNRLAGWRGPMISKGVWLTLLKAVITSIPTYILSAIHVPRATIKKILTSCGGRGCDEEQNQCMVVSHCRVNWRLVCRPIEQGGLGVLDLSMFAMALRLRWSWHIKTSPHKPWVGINTPCNAGDKDLFDATTQVVVGNGALTAFWTDRWVDGRSPMQIAPQLFKISTRKNMTVRGALNNNNWIKDICDKNNPSHA